MENIPKFRLLFKSWRTNKNALCEIFKIINILIMAFSFHYEKEKCKFIMNNKKKLLQKNTNIDIIKKRKVNEKANQKMRRT